MKLHYLTYTQLRIVFRGMRNLVENKVDWFCPLIYNNPNRILFPFSARLPQNKVPINIFPLTSWNSYILGQASRPLMLNLTLLTIRQFSNHETSLEFLPLTIIIRKVPKYPNSPLGESLNRLIEYWLFQFN